MGELSTVGVISSHSNNDFPKMDTLMFPFLRNQELKCHVPNITENKPTGYMKTNGDRSYKVSINGDLHPLRSDCAGEKDIDTSSAGLSVEVHFPEFSSSESNAALPIYEVVIDPGETEIFAEDHAEDIVSQCLSENIALDPDCSFDVADLCRICASKNPEQIFIFGSEGYEMQLVEKIRKHLPISVDENDLLPLHVCSTCVAQLNMCHELSRICQNADARLRELVQHKNQQQLEFESRSFNEDVETVEKIDAHGHTQSRELMKNAKFKVVVVKLSNKSLSKEEQLAKAIDMIKTSDRRSTTDSSHPNWTQENWNTHSFLCSECNKYVTGLTNFLQHQQSVHNIQLHHCNTCNTFCNSQAQLDEHVKEIHIGNNIRITNVAEIQLLNVTDKIPNLCMKVSKDFDKIDKCLKTKIVDAIQDIVLNDNVKCSLCNEIFNSKEKLKKHQRLHRVKHVDAVCNEISNPNESCKKLHESSTLYCSLCKSVFKSQSKLQEHSLSCRKSYICNYCDMKFLTKRLLLRHIGDHAEYKAFICQICGKGYNSKSSYEIHVSTHNTEKPYLCDLCGKSFKHVSNLKGHKRSHLSEEDKKKHGCPLCEKKFRCKFLVDEHMRMHTGERPFECKVCGKRFSKRQQLKQHNLVHSSDSFECHICGSRFNRRGNLTEHIKKHMNTKRYSCRVCKEAFPTISQMVAHRKSHSGEEMTQSKTCEESTDKNVMFQCHVCLKYLATKLSLVSHMRIHTGEKPFECEFCERKFSQKPALTYHRRRHTGEKAFFCSYCNDGFLSRNAKNIHERIHTGERPYSCYVCSTSFRCASSLSQHMIVHSDQRPFSCSQCSKCFRRREALQVHVRIHTGEKPYACDLCGRAFTQRGDMVKHRKTHANDKPYRCKNCSFVCTSRKELKKHAVYHTAESATLIVNSDNLITDFPELTDDCEAIILGSEEHEIDTLEITMQS